VIVFTPPGNNPFILKEGSGVFVSVAKSCDFFPLQLIQDVKLVPFVYKGLEELLPGRASNIHVEARADLERCQVFVVVLPLTARGMVGDRVWGYTELDILTRAGMKGFLYLPLIEGLPESQDVCMESFLPPYATIRNAPDCQSLNEILRQDLLALMNPPDRRL